MVAGKFGFDTHPLGGAVDVGPVVLVVVVTMEVVMAVELEVAEQSQT